MKALPKIKEIFKKYDFSVNIPEKYKTIYEYERKNPKADMSEFYPPHTDWYFIQAYANHIPKGWYGFSMGTPTPKAWFDFIDEALKYLISLDPDFEIHQIKIKWGALHFYCASNVIEDLNDIEYFLLENMFSEKLIY